MSRWQFDFSLLNPPTSGQQLSGTFAGVSSGAVFTPSTLGTWSFICGGAGQLIYAIGTPVSIDFGGAGLADAYEHVALFIGASLGFPAYQLDLYTNYGSFPTGVHPTGFTAGERFAFAL